MHVLFLPPLLLVASGWILGVSPWAVCSPMAGECEGEGEDDENLGVKSSWGAEPRKQVPDSRELVVAGLAGVCWHRSPLPDTKHSLQCPPLSLLAWEEQAGTLIFPSPCAQCGCVGSL